MHAAPAARFNGHNPAMHGRAHSARVRIPVGSNARCLLARRVAASDSNKRPTIYEKLGGREAVAKGVDIFYGKVLSDDRIKHFFDNVDMGKQRSKQMLFMMYAFGGPNEYKGRSMYDAHHGLHLTDEHFAAVAECFVATLNELGVQQDLIDQAVGVVAGTHDEVVGH